MTPEFVHLHLHTTYSLLDGANKIANVCARAKELGMPAIAMTDHGNLHGAVELSQEATKVGIKPIIGMEAYITPGSRHDRGTAGEKPNGKFHDYNHLILLATSDEGYRNLIKLTSASYTEGYYYKPRIDHELLAQHAAGLVALSGCLRGEVACAITDGNHAEARRIAGQYKDLFGDRYFFELQPNHLESQELVNRTLRDFSVEMGVPLVATNDCHYLHQQHAESHDILLCLQTGATVNQAGRFKFTTTDLYLKSQDEMAAAFAETPEALRNTVRIAEMCQFQFGKPSLQMPNYPIPPGETVDTMLHRLATVGLRRRLLTTVPAATIADYEQRLAYELDVITRLKYTGYFLVLWDIIHWSKTQGIPVGPGRGSAAGSLVAYAIGLTELDPIRHHLIFERFLNPDRVSPPDIDTDFCMNRRDEVIQHIRERFGSDHVAQIITFGTLGAKAVIRDVARVLEYPYTVGDSLAKLVPQAVGMTLDKAIESEPLLPKAITDKAGQHIIPHAKALEGLARHASTHAAGIVITPGPLIEHVPLSRTSDEEIVTQYTMEDLEYLGLVKFDFLGLRTLTVINQAVQAIRKQDPSFSVPVTCLDDPAVYQLIGTGNTIGVFQLENHGMRALLRRMKPSLFDDITAVIALYRPGPLESGMVDDYIDRKHGVAPIEYEFPDLEPILRDTYGTIVYQEQVIKISQVLCGMTAAQADLLRRAMGKKKPEEMAKAKKMFVDGGTGRGYPEAQISALYDKIALFAGYSFNRSHSAAYALLTYQTAYLKAHYPKEFMAAVLSSEQGHPDKQARYLTECRAMGVALLPPNINASEQIFTVSKDGIRFGLGGIKHVGEAAVRAILDARTQGPFGSLKDLYTRARCTALNKKVLEALIKTGACSEFGDRATLLETLPTVLKKTKSRTPKAIPAADQRDLLDGLDVLTPTAPLVAAMPSLQDLSSTTLKDEKYFLGVYLSGHPLNAFVQAIAPIITTTSETLSDHRDGAIVKIAGVITGVRLSTTKKGDQMAFVALEDQYGSIELVIFPNLYREMGSEAFASETTLVVEAMLDRGEERIQLKGQRAWVLTEATISTVLSEAVKPYSRRPLRQLETVGTAPL